MSDHYMIGNENESMFNWLEEHDKVCPFAYKGLINRFEYDSIDNNDLCVVRVTCQCGEIKIVTICCEE